MRGGKRPGAGRKSISGERGIVVSGSVPPAMVALIDRVAEQRGLTRSEVVRMALECFDETLRDMAK